MKLLSKLNEIETNNIDKILKIFFYLTFFLISFSMGFILKEKLITMKKAQIETETNYLGNGFYSGDTINIMCLNNIKYMRIENKNKTTLSILPKINPETNSYILCNDKNK
jgi:hypothetical protein